MQNGTFKKVKSVSIWKIYRSYVKSEFCAEAWLSNCYISITQKLIREEGLMSH